MIAKYLELATSNRLNKVVWSLEVTPLLRCLYEF